LQPTNILAYVAHRNPTWVEVKMRFASKKIYPPALSLIAGYLATPSQSDDKIVVVKYGGSAITRFVTFDIFANPIELLKENIIRDSKQNNHIPNSHSIVRYFRRDTCTKLCYHSWCW
jgi:hypothetical protein